MYNSIVKTISIAFKVIYWIVLPIAATVMINIGHHIIGCALFGLWITGFMTLAAVGKDLAEKDEKDYE